MADYQTDTAALQTITTLKDPDFDTLDIELAHFRYVHRDSQDTGSVLMGYLPPGRIRIYPGKSRILIPDLTDDAALVSVGYDDYLDGSEVIAGDPVAFADALPAGAGTIDEVFAGSYFEFNSEAGLPILVTGASSGDGIDTDETIDLVP
jgi:hypothetical protein